MAMYQYESHYMDVDGGRLHCRVAGAEDGLPLLFVHGLSGFSGDVEVLDGLPEGLRIISPDLLGFGDSSETADHRYPQDLMVSNLLAVLSRFAQGPALVVGHSRGSRTILGLPGADPSKVRALVMVDGAPSVPPDARLGVARNIAGTPHQYSSVEAAMETLGPRFPGYTNEQLKERMLHYLRRSEQGTYQIKRDLVYKEEFQAVLDGTAQPESGPDWWALFMNAKVPIYVVHALQSKMINNEIVEKMRSIRPDVTIMEVESGHNVPGEKPSELAECIARVIAELKQVT